MVLICWYMQCRYYCRWVHLFDAWAVMVGSRLRWHSKARCHLYHKVSWVNIGSGNGSAIRCKVLARFTADLFTVGTLTHWPLGNFNAILVEIVISLIFQIISVIDELSLVNLPLDECHLTLLMSTSVQVMAWQATSHYLSQCWPRWVDTNTEILIKYLNFRITKYSFNVVYKLSDIFWVSLFREIVNSGLSMLINVTKDFHQHPNVFETFMCLHVISLRAKG